MISNGVLLEAAKVATIFPNDGATTTVALAAGTSDVNSVSLDLQGFRGLSILIRLGAITSTGTVTFKIQGSDDNSTFVDIEGSSQAFVDTDANKLVGWDYGRFKYRYVRVATDRATANVAISEMLGFLYNAEAEPVTQPTGTGYFSAAPEIVAYGTNGTA